VRVALRWVGLVCARYARGFFQSVILEDIELVPCE
jgi:hypothetical protein